MNSFRLKKHVCVWGLARELGASLVLLLSCLPAFSQGGLGTIQGAITSTAGGPVAGAAVSVTDVTRGVTRPLTTDAAGLYSAAGLTPGPYTVRVQAMGFKTTEHTGITLPVGATLLVDFAMQPGAASEVVTITAEVLPANAAAEVSSQAVSETPENGRSFENLIESKNTGQTNAPGATGVTISSNGLRSDQNNTMIDGVYDGDINTGYKIVNGSTTGGVEPDSFLPLDAIGEITNNSLPKAEIGEHPGNVSNEGIKSGTNTLHGTLYGFGRDTDTNTRNPFRPPDTGTCSATVGGVPNVSVPCASLPGAGKTPYAMTQWGASIGGKIKKDKLFYFLNFERQRYNVGATGLDDSPTTASIGNAQVSIPDAIAAIVGNPANAGKLNQLGLNMAGCGVTGASGGVPAHTGLTVAEAQAMGGDPGSAFAPFCSSAVSVFNNGTSTATVPFGASSIGGPDSGLAKIDYRINGKNAVNGEIFVDNTEEDAFTSFSTEPWWLVNPRIRIYVARGVWVYTPSSTMINEARFGADLVRVHTPPTDCQGLNGAPNYIDAYGMDSGGFNTCQMPATTFVGSTGGFTALNNQNGKGPTESEPSNYQGLDSFAWTHGKHVIKFGVEIHRGVFTGTGGGAAGPPIAGSLSYGTTAAFTGANALEDFLTGTPTLGTVYVGSPTGIAPNTHINYYAAFIQDTYRLNRKVTVDVGLRYEYAPPFTNPGNLLGFYNPTACTAAAGAARGSTTGIPNCSSTGYGSGFGEESNGGPLYYQDTWRHNFGPRAAIAWDVFGTGRTVVRAVSNLMYATSSYIGEGGMQSVPTGADFYNPNGTFFTNPAGQNLVKAGTVQINSGIPFNVCNTALPGGISCTASQTFFGSAVAGATPACGDGLSPGGAAPANPAPCTLQIVNPNLYTPYVTSWALNLQQTLGRKMSLIIQYLGNHENGARSLVNINQPSPGPSGSVAEQERRPLFTNCPNGTIPGVVTGQTSGPCEPWIGTLGEIANSDISNYDALQATLSLRAYHGLTFDFNYTLAHCLDMPTTGESVFVNMENSLDPQSSYGTCGYGTPQRITANFNWAIPGRHSPGQLLQGWAVNGTSVYLPLRYAASGSSNPSGLIDTSDDISGTGNDLDHWNIFGTPHNFGPSLYGLGSNLGTFPCYGNTGSTFVNAGCAGPVGTVTVVVNGASKVEPAVGPGGICTIDAAQTPNSPSTVLAGASGIANTGVGQLLTLGCYVSGGTVLLPPAQGTFGDMSSNCCLMPGYFNLDLSITKTWGFMKEQRVKAQFRAEFFNVLNHVNYTTSGFNLGSVKTVGQFTSTPNAGALIVTGAGGEREVQFGLKFIW